MYYVQSRNIVLIDADDVFTAVRLNTGEIFNMPRYCASDILSDNASKRLTMEQGKKLLADYGIEL